MASKVFIVTGAGRGIGLAVSQYLLRASHKVVLVSRTQSELEALKAQYPSQVEYLAADLTDFENAPKVTDLALKSFGQLDGIVINHGVLSPMKRVADSTAEEWRKLFDANFFSAIALVKEAIPLLRETNGRIVFTSSGAAQHPYVSWGPYGSSKAAMNSLAQHIAVEEPSITTVTVNPGRTDTAMQKEIRDQGKGVMAEAERGTFVTSFEQGKLNKPEGPGHVMAKLVIDASQDLSGKFLSWTAPELAAFRD